MKVRLRHSSNEAAEQRRATGGGGGGTRGRAEEMLHVPDTGPGKRVTGVGARTDGLRRLRIFGQQDKLRADRSKGRETWA
jgi:hypothetical protein